MKPQSGGCHCGKVRFQITADVSNVISCNCSICMKRGSLLGFVTEEHFTLISGKDALSDYQFGGKTIHHTFCKHCGILGFGSGTNPKDGKMNYAINVRCLDDVDLSALKVTEFDGKKLP